MTYVYTGIMFMNSVLGNKSLRFLNTSLCCPGDNVGLAVLQITQKLLFAAWRGENIINIYICKLKKAKCLALQRTYIRFCSNFYNETANV